MLDLCGPDWTGLEAPEAAGAPGGRRAADWRSYDTAPRHNTCEAAALMRTFTRGVFSFVPVQ